MAALAFGIPADLVIYIVTVQTNCILVSIVITPNLLTRYSPLIFPLDKLQTEMQTSGDFAQQVTILLLPDVPILVKFYWYVAIKNCKI